MTRQEFLQQEIEKYTRRIDVYQAMIAEWNGELGASVNSSQSGAASDTTEKKRESGSGAPLSMIHGMVFFGKSQPEAAKAFLEIVKYPLTTSQILEGVEKGGVNVGGKTPAAKKQNLYTILNRSSEFARVKPDTWAVVGWPGVKKTSEEIPEPVSEENNDSAKASAEAKPL